MSCTDAAAQADMIDMVAQAVIDKLEERQKINALADMVFQRVMALQQREAELSGKEKENSDGREEE